MVTMWPNGQTQGREPRDPGMDFIVGCSSTFPDGILPASFSLPPDHTQTFVDCLLSAWLCAECSGGYRAQRHHLGSQGTHQWGSHEWTVPHQRLLRGAQGMFQIIRVEWGRALWVLAWDLESELRSKSGFQKRFLVVTLGPSRSLSEPQFAYQ